MYDELVKRLRGIHLEEYDDEWEFAYDCQRAMNEAADAIEELSKPHWISVTDRLPESGTRVLVMRFDFVTKMPIYDLLWFDKGEWWNRHFTCDYAVTHWMSLPEPPKEET